MSKNGKLEMANSEMLRQRNDCYLYMRTIFNNNINIFFL